ncbi:hypothetical protein [Halorubrum sp. HHNYT27]|uniref:hypothetical protein n=1 Tax=Halorubrum sp. HHNYT27 TaxID=3402275 RepID=UPI003EBAE8EC
MLRQLSVLLIVSILLTSALSGGVAADTHDDEDLFESLEEMVPAYNENAENVDLGPINLAGTTNIYIEDGDSELTYAVTMDDRNRITSLDDSSSDDAVRKITTDRQTLEDIAASENPAAAFKDAVRDNDIVITGEDGEFVENLKWAVINAVKGFFL